MPLTADVSHFIWKQGVEVVPSEDLEEKILPAQKDGRRPPQFPTLHPWIRAGCLQSAQDPSTVALSPSSPSAGM